jgi:phenylacetate-coenzyme A ligase PaaK-like adenylate-forming protein
MERSAREPLSFPLPVRLTRIAVIGDHFVEAKNIRFFDSADAAGLRAWAPEAIVTPVEKALEMADLSCSGNAPAPPPSSALVVLTSVGKPPLDAAARERLWMVFGVPIFEQLRAWDGTVIARECEVHDGMHVAEDAAFIHRDGEGEIILTLLDSKAPVLRSRTGLAAEIVRIECECGSEVPRLRDLSVAARLAREADAAGGEPREEG